MYLKNNKGVTLLALTITIIVMLIITGTVIYNTKSHIKIEKINKLYNDIELLNAKIEDYYLKYGELPVLAQYGEGKDFINALLEQNASDNKATLNKSNNQTFNPNDSDEYFVLDVEKLDGLSLNYGYGEDYTKVKNNEEDIISIGSALPEEYQQVDYIESTGTQYIDTRFIPNSNTSIEIKASNSATSNTCLYCARTGYTENTYTAFLMNGTSLRVDNYNTQYPDLITITSDIAYVYKQSKNLVYVNDNLLTTLTKAEFSTTSNMYLMASHQAGSNLDNIGNVKLYYCKIWDGDSLVRDLVPCYLKSDSSVAGLYDLVNNEFYRNKGTGKFEKGEKTIQLNDDIIDDIYIINKETHNIYYPRGIVAENVMYYQYNSNNTDVIRSDTLEDIRALTFNKSDETLSVESLKIIGNSKQDTATYGTPAPDNPVEVESVGDKTKNLFNGVFEQGTTAAGVKQDSTTRVRQKDTTTIEQNVDYVVSMDNADEYVIAYDLFDQNNNYITGTDWMEGKVINITEGKSIKLKIKRADEAEFTPEILNNIQLEKGTTATEYEPYGYKIPVKVTGKNLGTAQAVWNQAGDYTIVEEDGRTCAKFRSHKTTKFNPGFKENTQYTFSCQAKCITRANQSPSAPYECPLTIIYTDGTRQSMTVTRDAGWTNCKATSYPGKTISSIGTGTFEYRSDIYVDVNTFQIEEGTSVTTYEPYRETIYEICLDEPLRKIGNYEDCLDLKNGKIIRNIGEHICTTTNVNWTKYNNRKFTGSN